MAVAPKIIYIEGTSPTTNPATGTWFSYFKSDGLYMMDDAGAETKIVGPSTDEFSLNASLGYPSTTNGCAAAAQVEFGTNDVDIVVLGFDQTTIEYAQFATTMPENWDALTFTFKAYWTAAVGTATQTVEWNVQALSLGNDDAIDAAWGSSVEVSDALIALGDLHISSTSAAVTASGTPAAGDLIAFRVWRDATNDTMAGDARLIAIKIDYGTL